MLCGSLDGRGVWGGEWIYVYICIAESLCCSPKTITTLLISYSPIQNKTFLKIGGGLDLHIITWIEMRNTAWRENIKRHTVRCVGQNHLYKF